MLYSKLRKSALRTIAAVLTGMWLIAFISPEMPLPIRPLDSSTVHAAAESDAAVSDQVFHIAALGDSVTAGYEHGFTEQSVPYGYVEHVYEQALFHGLRAEYSNFGILGLKTTGLKKWLDAAAKSLSVQDPDDIQSYLPDPRAEQFFTETKQLRTTLEQADLIMMTIGGNDMYAVLATLEAGAAQEEADVVLQDALDTYEAELEASLRILLKLQPGVQIVVADQYLPIPPPIKAGALTIPLYPESDRLFLIDSLKQLRKRLDVVCSRLMNEGFHVKTASAANSFVGNELVYTSIAEDDVHPTRKGYLAMGKAFSKAIWGEYRTVTAKLEEAPVSVVVGGKELLSQYKPLLVQNRTFVPLRDITDAIGAELKWNAAARTATVLLEGRAADITTFSHTIRVNGITIPLNAEAAFMHPIGGSNKMYVPLAALSEGLGFQVVYREPLKTVFINK